MPRLTVLIVDDARSERLLLRHALTDLRRDLRIVEATDHTSALAAYRREPVNLVLLDIQLPRQSGITTLESLLAHDPAALVVMVSHHSTQKIVVKALRLGARGFIVKPYSLAQLEAILDRCAEPAMAG